MEKINEFNILGIILQIVVTVLIVIFGLIYFLKGKYLALLECLVSLDLFIMSYNNHKVYHKKKLSILYLIMAFLFLVIGILSFVGVI